jgi:MFS family permease
MSATASNRFEEQPYGWVVVAVATTCLALGFGANITVSIFMKPFEEEFGWLRADISMAYTLLTVGAAIGGIIWGSLSDRIGARWIGFFGAFAISAGLMALRWQNDLATLYLLYFLIGIAGFACLFTPMIALAGLWFNQRKGLAIGIVTAGGALGQGLVPYVTRLMITAFGWRDAALYLGLGYFLILFPLLFLLRPAPVLQSAGGQANGPPTRISGGCRTA